MGIHDLLKLLKPVMFQVHVSEFKNKTIAVDMMTWLYRGVYSCCDYINKDMHSDLYLNYPLKMIALLTQYNINVIAVFDGKDLKAKAQEDKNRLENKEKNLELAAVIEATGETETARKVNKRALTVTQKMINTLVSILKKLGIKCITAPYEADAQIAFLCKNRICDYAISEDSDLIAFGCTRILFKLQPNGDALYFDWDKFKNMTGNSYNSFMNKIKISETIMENDENNGNIISNDIMSSIREYANKKIKSEIKNEVDENKESQNVLSKDLMVIKRMQTINFIEFCVMMGCDYLNSLKGFGLKSGLKLFITYSNLHIVYSQIKDDKKYKSYIDKINQNSDESYLNKAKKVVSLFILQTVYNPITNTLVSLNNLANHEEFRLALEKYRIVFKSENEKNEFYGEHFDNYSDFCNNMTYIKEDDIESEEVIEKYYMKYRDLIFNKTINLFSNINNYDNIKNPENLVLDEEFLKVEMDVEAYHNSKSISYINKTYSKNHKNLHSIIDDDELERLFRSGNKNIDETKEKIINKKVEELVKIQVKNEKVITSLSDLLMSGDLLEQSKAPINMIKSSFVDKFNKYSNEKVKVEDENENIENKQNDHNKMFKDRYLKKKRNNIIKKSTFNDSGNFSLDAFLKIKNE